jgi:hypothetical protein
MAVITSVALGVFLLCGSLNLYFVVRNCTAAGPRELLRSTIPLIGGIAGIIGFMGIAALQPYMWAPLVLDLGSAGFLTLTFPRIIKEWWQFSAPNLLREYRSTTDRTKTGTLRLYRSGVFVLRLDFHRPENERGIGQFSRLGTWQETAAGLMLVTRDGKSAELSRNVAGKPATLGVTVDFPTFQTDADFAIAGLTFAAAQDSA